jgi:predicted dienelactone hydrolase
MNNLIRHARHIPVVDAVPAISFSQVTLAAPARGIDLELRITAPASGRDIPVVLFSHGHGPSLYIPSKDGYGPIASFWAERGFAVIQPTHLNSKVAGLPAGSPGGPAFWRSRVDDMRLILDRLDEIEAQASAFAGRLDHGSVAAVGHSLGAQTVGMLLGARLTDPNDAASSDVDMREPRIAAGVLLAAPGRGGIDLNSSLSANFSFLNPDFSHMTTRTLVVAGGEDVSPHLSTRGADWHADPYRLGPGADSLLTLVGAKHGLGGIAGYDAKETDDEDPDRLAVTQRMTWAYLRSALRNGDPAWLDACRALETHGAGIGRVESK